VLASFTAGNLVGRWQAESNANDAMGIDNGSLSGNVTYVAGRLVGKAFRTTAGAVVIPDSATLRPANITLEAVLRASPPGNNKYVISKSFNSTGSSYAFSSGVGGGLVFYVNAGGTVVTSPAISPAGIWDGNDHAVAGTYDGHMVRLYVDGVEIGSGTAATGTIQYGTSQSSGELLFGDFADTLTASNFNGTIDEVKLYNSALTAQAILADAFHPIVITSQPKNTSVVTGNNASFNVGLFGATPLGYQWQFNGNNIVGATNATLTITNAQSTNAGQYSVAISSGNVKFTTNSPFGTGQSFQLAQGTVTVPNDPSLQPASLSLQCWVRRNGSPGTFKYVISKSRGTGVSSYAFYTSDDGGLRFYIAAPGNPGFFATQSVASSNVWDGAWHQITGTFTDGGVVHLYLDGQEIGGGVDTFLASILYTPGAFSGDLLLGDFSPTAIAFHYPGDLDDVKLFDHELLPDDVLDTYTNPNGVTATSGLISWWKGDGNALDAQGLNPGVLPPPGFAQSSNAVLTVTVPASLINVGVSGGSFHATVSGPSGVNYIVKKSADLITWTPVITNTIPFTFNDPVSSNAKFYRAVAQ
jgi:Concanavalin A-like lectin/glucanases superfamily/Immunoglobulin domain